MRWRQALLAAAFALGAATYLVSVRGVGLTVSLAIALLVYAGVRVLLGTYYRSRYWYPRPGRNTRECRRCGRRISRRGGDLVTKCYHRINQHHANPKPEQECGWIPGWPGTRLLTRSVVARQFLRSITWQRLGVIALAGLLLVTPISISAGGAFGGASATSAGAGPTATPVAASDTATATATATAYPDDSERINETSVERKIFEGVNDRRGDRSMAPYSYNERAADAAEDHADHMAQNDYFSHTEPNGETQEERYAFCDGGENAAKTWVFQEIDTDWNGVVRHTSEQELAEGIVSQWMYSDPHRERGIYGEWWSSAGVGVSITETGEVYAVMGLCT